VALKFMHVLHCPQVHSLVLHRSPQPLHKHVVYPPLRRIFGSDLSEFEDTTGLMDIDKLLGKEADAVVVHKYTNDYEDPLFVVKTLYPPGKFKLQ
jgi:hypothetical protein